MREIRKSKIDAVSITNRTYVQKCCADSIIERANMMQQDHERIERLAKSECVVCYVPYGSGRAGGAMCTSQECAFCDTVLHSGNTCIDVLCIPCAKANGLCKHCGADVDLKQRRKRRAFQGKTLTRLSS